MIVGGIRLITYESRVTRNSGASGQGISVVAAPPVLPRASEHQGARARPGQVRRRDQSVVTSTDDDRVISGTHESDLLLAVAVSLPQSHHID